MISQDVTLDALLDLLAERVAARLAARDQHGSEQVTEGWHLIDLAEAAERLGRSTRWVRDRVKAGELPYIKLGSGGFLFEIDDLRTFAAARRVSADGPDPLAARLQAVGDRASRNGLRESDQVGYRRVSGAR